MERIKSLERIPTSDKFLLSKADTEVFLYSELKNIQDIDELLLRGSAIILYEKTRGDIGHWVCLTKRNNTIEYFDSYGRPPDPIKYLHGKRPYLSKLLFYSDYDLEYNEHNYQKAGMSTCGRHCIIRVLLKDEPLENYNKIMMAHGDPDELVTILSDII